MVMVQCAVAMPQILLLMQRAGSWACFGGGKGSICRGPFLPTLQPPYTDRVIDKALSINEMGVQPVCAVNDLYWGPSVLGAVQRGSPCPRKLAVYEHGW